MPSFTASEIKISTILNSPYKIRRAVWVLRLTGGLANMRTARWIQALAAGALLAGAWPGLAPAQHETRPSPYLPSLPAAGAQVAGQPAHGRGSSQEELPPPRRDAQGAYPGLSYPTPSALRDATPAPTPQGLDTTAQGRARAPWVASTNCCNSYNRALPCRRRPRPLFLIRNINSPGMLRPHKAAKGSPMPGSVWVLL